jgi:NADH:ubiquinone oxidoreductase subunit K
MYSMGAETRRQAISLLDLSLEWMLLAAEVFFITVCMCVSMNDHKSASCTDFGVTNMF